MGRFPFIALALVAVVMVGCGLGDGGTGESQKKQKPPEGIFDLPNGRSLYIECRGSGSPPVVFEVEQGDLEAMLHCCRAPLLTNT